MRPVRIGLNPTKGVVWQPIGRLTGATHAEFRGRDLSQHKSTSTNAAALRTSSSAEAITAPGSGASSDQQEPFPGRVILKTRGHPKTPRARRYTSPPSPAAPSASSESHVHTGFHDRIRVLAGAERATALATFQPSDSTRGIPTRFVVTLPRDVKRRVARELLAPFGCLGRNPWTAGATTSVTPRRLREERVLHPPARYEAGESSGC
jgi:hypothetical protein